MSMIADVLLDACKDSLLLIPFLYVTYVLIELLEHKASNKTVHMIAESHQYGPVIGSFLGAVPQCGFSAIASEFYTHRVITMGTLIAIYLSTSDEMLPILIAQRAGAGLILKILGIKVLIGMIFGFLIDLIMRNKPKIEHGCKIHNTSSDENIFLEALKHTAQVFIFIFLVSLAVGFGIAIIGEDNLSGFIMNKPVIGEILAALIGLIPNCAGSVIITQLYISGALGGGAVLSGLLVSAGIGPLMLFRTNSNKKENIMIICLLYGIGVGCGLVFTLLGIQL